MWACAVTPSSLLCMSRLLRHCWWEVRLEVSQPNSMTLSMLVFEAVESGLQTVSETDEEDEANAAARDESSWRRHITPDPSWRRQMTPDISGRHCRSALRHKPC